MTCINTGNAIICVSPWGRLHVGNRYIMVDFHPYCGPSFYTDRAMTKLYDPVDEQDPVWDAFEKWYKKYQEKERLRDEQKKRLREAKTSHRS